MRQIAAILLDSYRELRSRSLFWITLGISVLVAVALFALIRFDETGWGVLWFETHESEVLRANSQAARDLLAWLFGGVLLWWWLTWGAVVVALIATSSTIPEFVSSGSIDVVLAKPIGRLKLLVVKIVGATLFMLLQVSVSVAIAYLLLGLRFDMWFHDAWLAVPLVALQFLYLFVVMALAGLVTRSTLASLLMVLVFWAMVSLVQFASNQVDNLMAQSRETIARSQQRVETLQAKAATEGRELTGTETARIASWQNMVESNQTTLDAIEPWAGPIHLIELCVPKTGDIQKIIADRVDAPTFDELMLRLSGFDPEVLAQMTGMNDVEMVEDMQQAGVAGSRAVRQVDSWRSIGSSMVFVILVVGLTTIVFVRRDF